MAVNIINKIDFDRVMAERRRVFDLAIENLHTELSSSIAKVFDDLGKKFKTV